MVSPDLLSGLLYYDLRMINPLRLKGRLQIRLNGDEAQIRLNGI